MENASKALIMAATVLIGIMLIGIMVYLFRTGAIVGENYENKKTTEQIEAFNAKFEVFQRENNTISDVISAANLAYSINARNEYDNINKVEVVVKLSSSSGATTFDIISDENLPKNTFYKNRNESTKINFYDLMSKDIKTINSTYGTSIAYINETNKLTDINTYSSERQYRYYFKVGEDDLNYNGITGLIDKITFIIDAPKKFDYE